MGNLIFKNAINGKILSKCKGTTALGYPFKNQKS